MWFSSKGQISCSRPKYCYNPSLLYWSWSCTCRFIFIQQSTVYISLVLWRQWTWRLAARDLSAVWVYLHHFWLYMSIKLPPEASISYSWIDMRMHCSLSECALSSVFPALMFILMTTSKLENCLNRIKCYKYSWDLVDCNLGTCVLRFVRFHCLVRINVGLQEEMRNMSFIDTWTYLRVAF